IHLRPLTSPLNAPLQRTHDAIGVARSEMGLPRVHPLLPKFAHRDSNLANLGPSTSHSQVRIRARLERAEKVLLDFVSSQGTDFSRAESDCDNLRSFLPQAGAQTEGRSDREKPPYLRYASLRAGLRQSGRKAKLFRHD